MSDIQAIMNQRYQKIADFIICHQFLEIRIFQDAVDHNRIALDLFRVQGIERLPDIFRKQLDRIHPFRLIRRERIHNSADSTINQCIFCGFRLNILRVNFRIHFNLLKGMYKTKPSSR